MYILLADFELKFIVLMGNVLNLSETFNFHIQAHTLSVFTTSSYQFK